MKKFIIFIITLFMIFSLISCSKTANYKVLEMGGYDSISGAAHAEEFKIDSKEYKKILIKSEKTIEVNGVEWDVEYTQSRKDQYYKNKKDYYKTTVNGVEVDVGVNSDTGVVDAYYKYDKEYAEKNKDREILSEEACFNIAKTYLDKYINSDEYEVIDVKYREIREYKALYDFKFVRVIDGIETSDIAYIGVTVFGDVSDHLFLSLGQMAEATLPSSEEMKAMDDSVYAKLDTIYENISSEYEKISYEIDEKIFVRLSDGKYAFEYYVDVTLEKGDDSEPFTEMTRLIVYV